MSDSPGAALITGASSGIGVEFARLGLAVIDEHPDDPALPRA